MQNRVYVSTNDKTLIPIAKPSPALDSSSTPYKLILKNRTPINNNKQKMGSNSAPPSKKPHAVLVPYPAQGHVTPMLKLAKLLHSLHNFHVTFVNTEFNHGRLLNSHGHQALDSLPDFRFETIPDGLPPSDQNVTQDIPALCDSTTKNCLEPFKELLFSLNADDSVPNVDCVVTDGVMTFALDAAKELGVPGVLLWTASACGLLSYRYYHELIARGLVPLKVTEDVTNGYLDTPINWIPGLTKNMRLKDVPTFIRTTDPNDIMLNFFVRESERASLAAAIIINTFTELENFALQALSSTLPPIYTIGPLNLLSHTNVPHDSPLSKVGSSLWKEESSCITWLNGKKPGSVLLVNFGSITTMTEDNLVEFAWGLANSGVEFLWVLRPDLLKGQTAVVPKEFGREVEGRGMMAGWCNQEAVLMHEAIGAFLTHCGWNSCLESVSGGVSVLCWPFFAEQQTNCMYMCGEWGMGMEIGNEVRREEVERIVKEMMGGVMGKEMSIKAKEWKKFATRATKVGGESYLNLERVVKRVMLKM